MVYDYEKHKQQMRDYYYKNREARLEYQKEYVKKHRKEITEKQRIYRKEHPEKVKVWQERSNELRTDKYRNDPEYREKEKARNRSRREYHTNYCRMWRKKKKEQKS